MSRSLLQAVLAALESGAEMPEMHEGLSVHWRWELAPGETDEIDELHHGVEVITRFDRVMIAHSVESIEAHVHGETVELSVVQAVALRERWEDIYFWPYEGQLEDKIGGIAA